MGAIIEAYDWFAKIILQEWAVKTIGIAVFTYVWVSVIRGAKYGKNGKSREKIKKEARRYYIPLNFILSIIFALKYISDDMKYGVLIDWYDEGWWFFVFSSCALLVHIVWDKGIGPYMDKRWGTNWRGLK